MRNRKNLFMLLLVVFSLNVNAQDTNEVAHNVNVQLPNVALLDLETISGNSITLAPTAPTVNGSSLSFDTVDNSIWINYSSIIGSSTQPSRNVSVQITSGSVPAGIELSVFASADSGRGDGTMGTPTQPVILNLTSQEVITGIGSAYTGDGVNKGHNLTYALSLSSVSGSYAQLDIDDTDTVIITYTLNDN